MKIFDEKMAKKWLKDIPLANLNPYKLEDHFQFYEAYHLPVDTGHKTRLARVITENINNNGFLWITDWGAWPSCNNMDLWDGYRRSLGETRCLIDSPFHLFSPNDLRIVRTLLGMSLYFFWDAILSESPYDFIINTSNDEFIDIYANSESSFNKWTNCFNEFELEKMTKK